MTTFTYNGHSYLLSNAGTWQEAQAEAVSFGGNLVTINDQAEQDWLASTFASNRESFWIGYTDQETEGTWKWISSENSTYTNWEVNQPDNADGKEDYAHIWGSASRRDYGSWNDSQNNYFGSMQGIIEIPTIQSNGGIIITDLGGNDGSDSLALQTDGKILLGGSSYNWNDGSWNGYFSLVRYNGNGSLDTSFDGDGKVYTDLGDGGEAGRSVAIQSDGKILLGGGSNNNFALVRYNSNGSLDTSFDGDGKVITDMGANDEGKSVAIQTDGKILLGGISSNDTTSSFALIRYNPNGSLDTSFSGDGIVTTDFDGYSSGSSVTIQADGKILLGGWCHNLNGNDDFALARYNTNGTLDASFGVGGKVTTDFGGNDYGSSVVVQADGKILLSGMIGGGGGNSIKIFDAALIRYNANGSLDTSFGVNGIVTKDFDGGYEGGGSISVQPDGKIFQASGTNSNIALIKYNSNGSLDTSFNWDGSIITNLGETDGAGSLKVQADGKILQGGYSDSNFALVRYNSDGSLDSTFDGLTPVNHPPTGTVTINDTTPQPNQVLTAYNTLADADGMGAVSYLWFDGSVPISLTFNQGPTYRVTANDVGKSFVVVARYTDGLGNNESVRSYSTSPVTAPVSAGFTIIPQSQLTSEQGDSASYNISLNTAPFVNQNVTLTFTSSDTSEGVIDNSTLIFTSSNYATPQTLTVRGVDDYLDDGNIPYLVTAKVSTIDVFYKSLTISPFSMTNFDDGADVSLDLYGDEGGSKIDVLSGGNGADTIHGLNMADNLSGGLGNDTLYGGYGADNLFGEEGNDKLLGEQEADYLDGGVGNDTLDGGDGVDTMIGGAGNDTYYLGYDATDVIDDQGLSTDVDTVIMPYQLTKYTLPAGIEKGTIAAGLQASSLTGNGSNNMLTGNDGSNTLSGAVGRDSLFGGSGNDVLNGGTGNDVMTGGNGKDSFVLNTALTLNTDKIADFKPVDDTIKLENLIFTKLTVTGVLGVTNFFVGAAAHDPNDYVIYNPTTGAVTYDSDGSGAGQGVIIATLGVNLTVTNADFVVF